MELTSHSWTRTAANSGATDGSWTISRWSASRLGRALVLGALAATAVTSVSGAGAAGAAWTAPAAPGPLTAVVVRASAGHLAQAAPGVAEVSANAVVTVEGDSYDPSADPNGLLALQAIVGTRLGWHKGTGAGVDVALIAEQAWRHGIVTVVSAGNSGAASGRLTDPAIDPYVIAVGADDTNGTAATADDTIPAFSSRGDGVRNPDLVAPGTHVQSLRVPGSYIDTKYGSTGLIGDRFFRGSGTSQSAAFVSGSVAQLVSQHPGYTPDQIKALLVGTATRLPSANPVAQGAGLINMRAVAGSTLSLAAVLQSFPRSFGAGTLEGSRGSSHLVATDPRTGESRTLTGETGALGTPVSTTALAANEANATSGNDGLSDTNRWTSDSSGGSSNSLATNSTASSSWASSSWASSSRASSSWTDAAWQSSFWG